MENELNPLQKLAVSRKLIEAEIVALAWTDASFRAKLEADPVAALKEAGFPLPEGRSVRVVTEQPDTLQITLPPAPAEASDAELASVAGGGIIGDGKCHMFEEAKGFGPVGKVSRGTVIGLLGAFGASWGWG